MGISEILTSIGSSVMAGGATGIIGAIVSRVGDYYKDKQEIEKLKLKYENEIELRHADARIVELEYAGRNTVAMTEGQNASDIAETRAFEASYQFDSARLSSPSKLSKFWSGYLAFFDGLRSAVRPSLTAILCITMLIVYLEAARIIKDKPITPDQAFEIYMQIATNIIYLNSCVVLWWFGTSYKNKKKT